MNRSTRVFLHDILESIDKILSYVEGVDREAFAASSQLQDAVARRFEVMGEAAKNVPEKVRAAHPEVRWRGVSGLRDVLIHAYGRVDPHSLWDVVEDELPLLREQIARLLDSMPVD